jgi:protein-disulfide isomerase/uncharacterized membrane protein
MLGVLTVVHLAIQEARGFDRGCFGVSGAEAGTLGFDCSTVVSSGAGTLFGLSNITWGIGFYGAVAVLTLIVFGMPPRWRRWVQGARAGLIVAGMGYSAYLVYVQVGVLGTLCALCLLSALLTALLFAVQLTVMFRPSPSGESTLSTRLFKRDVVTYVYLVALTAVLVGADLTYFAGLPPAESERGTAQERRFSGAACQLDLQKDPVDVSGLVNSQDLSRGASAADVTVIEYFDPNCPHCKAVHETMKTLVSEHGDDVRFVFKPFPLRGTSLPELQALYVADRQGKFAEMLDAQYAHQSPSGIDVSDLRAIAEEIDMPPDALLSPVENDEYRQRVLEERTRALKLGIESTPTILVNGHFVGSRSLECMQTFIERAKDGKLAPKLSG